MNCLNAHTFKKISNQRIMCAKYFTLKRDKHIVWPNSSPPPTIKFPPPIAQFGAPFENEKILLRSYMSKLYK